MQLSSWLKTFGRNLRRPRSNGLTTAAERMEDRSLLSVAALFVGGELFVSSDGADDITIQQNSLGRVEVLANNVILGTAPSVATSSVTSIVVRGGDEANVINLNGVTSTTYPSLTGGIRIDGDDGDDTITGSPTYGDSILGGDGIDSIDGQAGNDTLDGGDGNDFINGQDGDDSLIGEDGNDVISGGIGNDTISGGNHLDTITGDAGNDSIDAGQNNDSVSGGLDNDTINGSDGADVLNGDAGTDSIFGGAGNDLLSGGTENDTLFGQSGNDSVNGELGDDSVDGGAGTDSVSGGLGNDFANGGSGNDSVFGNEGDDTMLGGSGNDTLDGFIGNDRLLGQGGNDSLLGGGGADSLDGGAGEDVVDSADPLPEAAAVTITVGNATIVEGDAGATNLVFTLNLSATSFLPISVTASTIGSTATDGTDYTGTGLAGQVVTFAPGTLTATLTIPVTPDVVNETDEVFRVQLSNAVNAELGNQEAFGTITNDDIPPTALYATTFFGTLARLNPATGQATIAAGLPSFGIHDITANAANQLIGFNGTSLFRINPNTGAITPGPNVIGLPGGLDEGDVAFDVANNVIYAVFSTFAAGNPNLFQIDVATGVATDRGEIQVGTGNLSAAADFVEFDYLAFRPAVGAVPATLFGVIAADVTGTNANFDDALFSINLASPPVAVRVGALGVDLNPGSGGLEWDAANNRLLLLDGAFGTNQTLYRVDPGTGTAVPVGPTFLNNASGLTFAENPAVDGATFSVSDGVVVEGDQGTTSVSFTITRTSGTGAATVTYTTVDGTATAGSDYVAQSQTLAFAPGQTTQIVTVVVNSDFSEEADEIVFLQLTASTGAIVRDGSGNGTITNDDAAPLGDTMLGNTGDDTIHGGPAADFINSDGGIDIVNGNGGNDTILGGVGPDTINGGEGNDSINGQGGADVIDGGNGDDIVVWEGGASSNDTISNSSGADGILVSLNGASNVVTVGQALGLLTITEGSSTVTVDDSVTQVTVDGGSGDDLITVTNIDQVIRGSLTIRGGLGNDFINAQGALIGTIRLREEGGVGDDTLFGSEGNDTLAGDAGTDRLRGFGGNDLGLGGAGVDSITGEDGNDTLLGGDGTDSPTSGDLFDILNGGAGNDSLRGELGGDSLFGGDGDDTIRGGDGNDTISGDLGNDSLLGDTASDNITGGEGDDTLDGGRNNDVLNGNAGNDKLRGDHGDDTIAAGSGNDTANGGDGDDVIQGQSGDDLITGADGDDTIHGSSGHDTIAGGDGDDVITGGDGNDAILGEQGDDSINGNSSTDTLSGGQGDDTLVGASASEIDEAFALDSGLLSALSAT